jgi:hypothetical protein
MRAGTGALPRPAPAPAATLEQGRRDPGGAGQELEDCHHAKPRCHHEHEDGEDDGGDDVGGKVAPELLEVASSSTSLNAGRLG